MKFQEEPTASIFSDGENGVSGLLRNLGTVMPDYTATHSRTQKCSYALQQEPQISQNSDLRFLSSGMTSCTLEQMCLC
jgi:hypothetical protein